MNLTSKINISIAVLAYNEASNLKLVVTSLNTTLTSIPGSHEIIIINDGSRDNTQEVADFLQESIDIVRIVTHKTNMGLGAVYRTGFKEAKKDFLTFWPADGQFNTDIIKNFAKQIPNYDLILGYLPNHKRGLTGSILSLGEQTLYRILFGKIPKFQGVLMLRTEMLKKISLVSSGRGWTVIIEFIIKASRQNFKIKSIPTDLSKRVSGKSKVINTKTVTSNFLQILKLRIQLFL